MWSLYVYVMSPSLQCTSQTYTRHPTSHHSVIPPFTNTITSAQLTMSAPLITFKAGRCDLSGRKVTPVPTPGYLYLTQGDDEDFMHLCWRPRSAPASEPELDLLMITGDASFHPLVKEQGTDDLHSPTNGRIFALRFQSSGERHFFWMQSKSQHTEGKESWFSARDQRLGQIVDLLINGEDVDVAGELEELRQQGGGNGPEPDADADAMEVDEQDNSLSRQETGGAGQDATGGDPREEGESSREGGADGGRA